MKFIALIPARYDSTRFPGKPLALIGNKPMIRHVYERVSSEFGTSYVATDDKRIYEAVKDFGGNAVMTSREHRSGTDRCREALDVIERLKGEHFDVVVNVQGDEPFLQKEHLELIKDSFSSSEIQIATLIKRFGEKEDIFNTNSPKVVVDEDGFALYFSRNAIPFVRDKEREDWQSSHVFYKHIGMYAYRSAVLRELTELPPGKLEIAESLEQLRWLEHGYRIKTTEAFTETIAVDTPEDLERLNLLKY